MPIYEYRVSRGHRGCQRCQAGLEVIQGIREGPLERCPQCHAPVDRVPSRVNLCLREEKPSPVEKKIREYEKSGMYRHAAELADKEAEKTKRDDLKDRALNNYRKAGYKDL